jgi:Mat/Ecp fimbriae periplasmic chaperone
MYSFLKTSIFALFALGISPAFAGIYLDKIVVEFDPNGLPREDIVVFNDDTNDNAYIDITIHEVINPGLENEERILVENPQDANLLVTPAKMVVAPGSKSQVRLVSLNQSSPVDQIFRVTFTPVLAPFADEGSAVRIVVAYQALVIVPPNNQSSDLSYEKGDGVLTFTNSGNSYIKLENGQLCGQLLSSCVDLMATRLYAGNTWSVDLPFDGQVTYRAVNNSGVRSLVID